MRRETGKEYVVKDPMGVWIATGALGRVRLLTDVGGRPLSCVPLSEIWPTLKYYE